MRQYSRGGQAALLDRVRKLLVPDTPEERVRQEFVNRLIERQRFPSSIVDTEYHLSHTPLGAKECTRKRADVVVWERMGRKALLLAEVKSPSVTLDESTLDQVMRYQRLLPARYVVITNGTETRSYRVDRSRPIQISGTPKFSDLELYSHIPDEGCGGRLSYSQVTEKTYLAELEREKYGVIGVDTPKELHPVLSEFDNFLLCHEFGSHLPVDHHGMSVLKDLGQAYRTRYGNASGGSWPGWYRGFLVRDLQGDHQTYWVAIMAEEKTKDHPKLRNRKGTTYLIVAVDDFDLKSHNTLQMCLDSSLCSTRTGYRLTHDGKKSGIPSAEVLHKVHSLAPHLLTEDASRVYLGSISSGRSLSWRNCGTTLLNLLLYASIRESMKKQTHVSLTVLDGPTRRRPSVPGPKQPVSPQIVLYPT